VQPVQRVPLRRRLQTGALHRATLAKKTLGRAFGRRCVVAADAASPGSGAL
jgi:hypothetical protein